MYKVPYFKVAQFWPADTPMPACKLLF